MIQRSEAVPSRSSIFQLWMITCSLRRGGQGDSRKASPRHQPTCMMSRISIVRGMPSQGLHMTRIGTWQPWTTLKEIDRVRRVASISIIKLLHRELGPLITLLRDQILASLTPWSRSMRISWSEQCSRKLEKYRLRCLIMRENLSSQVD